ncbi:rCG37298 [Rattus norvegicus]|uniref:RCG37298 n=1 Tax=Rattus norvegicus TaxID=10116 RepID=A6KIA7_RAT|nr:rCG37298 [Rattus norvegicus]
MEAATQEFPAVCGEDIHLCGFRPSKSLSLPWGLRELYSAL